MMSSSRKFVFDYHVKVGAHGASLDLWLPAPRTDAYQAVTSTVIASPVSLSSSEDSVEANRILHCRLPASEGDQQIIVRHQIERMARLAPSSRAPSGSSPAMQAELARFLRADSHVPIDGVVAEMVATISRDTPPLERARQVFLNLLATLDYDARGCTPERAHDLGDLVVACDLKRGTCTEFHGLYVAHARALGLPARFAFGFNIPKKPEGRIAGYHCWAEVYLPERGWWAVDVSEAWKRSDPNERNFYFGNLDVDRVQFTTGRDIALTPPPSTGLMDRFIFPLAEMEGRPVEVGLAFSFVSE
jgi:transglutaminase-like putative cysteine protease